MRVPAALVLAAAAHVALAAPPARLALVYDLARDGQTIAEVVETLEHGDGRYTIVSEAKGRGALAALPLGSFRRESRGEVTEAGLRPRDFRDLRAGRLSVATLDWSTRELVTESRGRSEVHPLEGPTHDRLTQLYTFGFAPPPSDGAIAMRVTDGRGVADQRYVVARREPVEVGAGRFDALRLERVREPGDRRETVVWLAVEHDYLPVRILLVERDGARTDQTLQRIEP
jgi:hypothetical protein